MATLLGCIMQPCAAAVGTVSQEATRIRATVVVQDQKLTIPVFDVMMYVLLIILGYILSKGNVDWEEEHPHDAGQEGR